VDANANAVLGYKNVGRITGREDGHEVGWGVLFWHCVQASGDSEGTERGEMRERLGVQGQAVGYRSCAEATEKGDAEDQS
jgi:hypothetical protein